MKKLLIGAVFVGVLFSGSVASAASVSEYKIGLVQSFLQSLDVESNKISDIIKILRGNTKRTRSTPKVQKVEEKAKSSCLPIRNWPNVICAEA